MYWGTKTIVVCVEQFVGWHVVTLHSKVPGLAENRPSVLRGDRLFAYESGVMTTRYEGIVHVVELEDVKIGFDLNR